MIKYNGLPLRVRVILPEPCHDRNSGIRMEKPETEYVRQLKAEVARRAKTKLSTSLESDEVLDAITLHKCISESKLAQEFDVSQKIIHKLCLDLIETQKIVIIKGLKNRVFYTI